MNKNGFTLIEIALTIATVAIILTLSFNVFSLRKDIWFLKQKAFGLVNDLSNVKKLSFKGLNFEGQKICGTGLLFDASLNNYLGVALASENKDCFSLDSANFDLTGLSNLEGSQNVIKLTKFFSPTKSTVNLLKKNLEAAQLKIFCYGSGCPNRSGRQIIFQKFEIIFKNPYAEPLIFFQNAAVSQEIVNWNRLQFNLQFKNEPAINIIVTKTGQILSK
jgi:hypothetical protein